MIDEPTPSPDNQGKPGPRARRALDIALPLRIVVGVAFITIVTLTIAQIFFRFVLDSPLIWSEELARVLLVWMTFLGAAVVCWDGRHLNVDVLFNRLPAGFRRVVRRINGAIALTFLGILVWHSVRLVRIDGLSDLGSLGVPASVVRLPATIGGALMIAFIVLRWVYRVRVEGNGPQPTLDPEDEPM